MRKIILTAGIAAFYLRVDCGAQLIAILCADVHSYSRLMGDNERLLRFLLLSLTQHAHR
jgi:hypothetical protein